MAPDRINIGCNYKWIFLNANHLNAWQILNQFIVFEGGVRPHPRVNCAVNSISAGTSINGESFRSYLNI